MALFDLFRGRDLSLPEDVQLNTDIPAVRRVLGQTVERLWEDQPALRTVVSFRARNVAQLGLQTFQRVSDTDRKRLTGDQVSQLLAQPNPQMTTYELLYDLVSTIDLYDVAYWMVSPTDENGAVGWAIRPIPAGWVTGTNGGSIWAPDEYVVSPPGRPQIMVAAKNMLVFRGWSPRHPKGFTSPVQALRQTLAEQISADEFRMQVWRRSGRVGGVVTRPPNAPKWSDLARGRFVRSLRSRFSAEGPGAGSDLLLEDGMTYDRPSISAKDQQYVDAKKLSVSTVAAIYHVNPTMVGQIDNANFSNVREFRRMLYTETLGPLLTQIQDRLNTFLVPQLTTLQGVYVEFNIGEKLRGSFEEQASVLSTSVGRPWMTANEARARNNLPAIDGGDELVTPLNVLVGGQASPQDGGAATGTQSAPAPHAKSRQVKSRPSETQTKTVATVFADFFERQSKVILSKLGAKAGDDWWDADRWTKELHDDLLSASKPLTVAVARKAMTDLGLDPDSYDVDRTVAYLNAVLGNTSDAVNRTTKAQLDAALQADDPQAALVQVFALAKSSRSDEAGATLATALASFATVESVHQSGREGATKTWVVKSLRPRPSHAAMSDQTVPLDATFSNGARWPGDSSALGVDDIAGCTCDVTINIP